jgi:hypothetical protein
MDQQSIVLYLARKGLSAFAIHHDLVATLGEEAISYQLSIGTTPLIADRCLDRFE